MASYVRPKTGNRLRSHFLRAMALDHRRLIRPAKTFRPNFLRSTSLLYKILPTCLGKCNPTFYTFYTLTSEVKQYHEALFLSYRPRTECSISQFCNTNCTHSPDSLKIQDDAGNRCHPSLYRRHACELQSRSTSQACRGKDLQ